MMQKRILMKWSINLMFLTSHPEIILLMRIINMKIFTMISIVHRRRSTRRMMAKKMFF